MTAAFVDTSALYALLVRSDQRHAEAQRIFERLTARHDRLVSTSYVLVETYALLARRVGLEAAKALRSALEPLLDVVWVDQHLHGAGLDGWARQDSRDVSLVDAVSFAVMRERKIDEAFAFDQDFERAGFDLLR